ncbi:hypothetical protein Afil01_62990 [Actinorhabdospora filicis]|uniref:Uncharacterized protein n=2 Tax=Actinorhabdospora filicis TaxID=1785913 RepID=A0A9W6SSI5_9ACTN|nr:hypothetical protein Afil01_62990 [Actinorhabdospora filicis]
MYRVMITLLCLGALAGSAPVRTTGCGPVQPRWMRFRVNTPAHALPAGGSPVRVRFSTPQIVDGECVSAAGNHWWRLDMGTHHLYVYDGYRL